MWDNKIKPITPTAPITQKRPDPQWPTNKNKSNGNNKDGKSFSDILKKEQDKKK